MTDTPNQAPKAVARTARPASVHPIPDRLGTWKTNHYTAFVRVGDAVVPRSFLGGGISEKLAVAGVGPDADQILFLFGGQTPENMLLRPVGPDGRPPSKARAYTVLARRGGAYALRHIRFGGGEDGMAALRAEGWEPLYAVLNHCRDMRGIDLIPTLGADAAPSDASPKE